MITDLGEWKKDYFPKNLFSSGCHLFEKTTKNILLNIQRFKIYYPSTLIWNTYPGHTHLTKNQKKELNHEKSGDIRPYSEQYYYLNKWCIKKLFMNLFLLVLFSLRLQDLHILQNLSLKCSLTLLSSNT